MIPDQASLARKHLERRLAPLRDLQLAARMKAAPSRIPAIEKAEVTGATTIRTLREAAAAMNCTFVYAFVPTRPLDTVLRERAAQKIGDDISRLDHTMKLENQALQKADLDDEKRRLVELLLAGSPRRLWEED